MLDFDISVFRHHKSGELKFFSFKWVIDKISYKISQNCTSVKRSRDLVSFADKADRRKISRDTLFIRQLSFNSFNLYLSQGHS